MKNAWLNFYHFNGTLMWAVAVFHAAMPFLFGVNPAIAGGALMYWMAIMVLNASNSVLVGAVHHLLLEQIDNMKKEEETADDTEETRL